jgi:hypothetical protein
MDERAEARIGQKQIQMVLNAIQPLDGQPRGIGRPVHARDEKAAVSPRSIQRVAPPVAGTTPTCTSALGAGLRIALRLGDRRAIR